MHNALGRVRTWYIICVVVLLEEREAVETDHFVRDTIRTKEVSDGLRDE